MNFVTIVLGLIALVVIGAATLKWYRKYRNR